jgi:hypothetical protein
VSDNYSAIVDFITKGLKDIDPLSMRQEMTIAGYLAMFQAQIEARGLNSAIGLIENGLNELNNNQEQVDKIK